MTRAGRRHSCPCLALSDERVALGARLFVRHAIRCRAQSETALHGPRPSSRLSGGLEDDRADFYLLLTVGHPDRAVLDGALQLHRALRQGGK